MRRIRRISLFQQALQTSSPIPEEKCSRIYIQGLSEKNNPDIALVFDKYPTRGGDHFRRPWGPWQREICMLDGSMNVIEEKDWQRFAKNQIELLVREASHAHWPNTITTSPSGNVEPTPVSTSLPLP